MSGGSRDPVLRIAGGGGGGGGAPPPPPRAGPAAPGPAPPGSATSNRELKQPPPRQHDKTTTTKTSKNSYFQQNNSFARAWIFFVHFFDDYCTTTTWNLLMRRFLEDVDMRWSIFLSLFEPGYKVLNNSTPRKIAYIWHIEQVQIDALKFERRHIRLFSDVFTAVVAIVDTCLSSLYHWIDLKNEHDLWTKGL